MCDAKFYLFSNEMNPVLLLLLFSATVVMASEKMVNVTHVEVVNNYYNYSIYDVWGTFLSKQDVATKQDVAIIVEYLTRLETELAQSKIENAKLNATLNAVAAKTDSVYLALTEKLKFNWLPWAIVHTILSAFCMLKYCDRAKKCHFLGWFLVNTIVPAASYFFVDTIASFIVSFEACSTYANNTASLATGMAMVITAAAWLLYLMAKDQLFAHTDNFKAVTDKLAAQAEATAEQKDQISNLVGLVRNVLAPSASAPAPTPKRVIIPGTGEPDDMTPGYESDEGQ